MGFRSYLQFFVKTRFSIEANIYNVFSTCKKINDIFLKFSHSLFKMTIVTEHANRLSRLFDIALACRLLMVYIDKHDLGDR